MELFREEYELKKPKNWGKITFQNIQRRTEELNLISGDSKVLSVKPSVRQALEAHIVVSGPLNATDVLESLTEQEQCDFFSSFDKCTCLTLQRWTHLSGRVMRCIAITMSESLTDLDLSYSSVDVSHLEILVAHVKNLQVLRLAACPRLDGSCIQAIAKLASHILLELYVNECQLFRIEPLLCIGGCVGVGAHSLGRLRALNLSGCPAHDKGLVGLASGCKQIRFLNLENCIEITDISVCALATSNSQLQLINLSSCSLVSNKSVIALAKHCPNLISINLSKCSSITDSSLIRLAKGCHKLQAVNLVGLISLTENCMYELCRNCPGILMMNMSGCANITVNGLKAMVRGLKYVQMSVSFIGFHPIDSHVSKKLADHLDMLRDSAVELIRDWLEKRNKKFCYIVQSSS